MITEKELIEFGMIKQEDLVIPFMKPLSESSNEITIMITNERNKPEIALKVPNGIIFLGGVQSIDDLNTIERCITDWNDDY
jgi:hypothetical protein